MGGSESKIDLEKKEKERILSYYQNCMLHLEFEPFLLRWEGRENKIIRLKRGNKFTEKFLDFLKKNKIFVKGEYTPSSSADNSYTFFKKERKKGKTGFYEDRLKFSSLSRVLYIFRYHSYKFNQSKLTISIDLRLKDLFYFVYLDCVDDLQDSLAGTGREIIRGICTKEQFKEEVTRYIEEEYSKIGSKEMFGSVAKWTSGDIGIIDPGEMDKYHYDLGLKTKKISFDFGDEE